jgi:hypothetical protein
MKSAEMPTFAGDPHAALLSFPLFFLPAPVFRGQLVFNRRESE